MTTIANNRNEANAVLKYGPSTDHTYSSMDGKNITLQIRYRKTSLGADIDITKSIEFQLNLVDCIVTSIADLAIADDERTYALYSAAGTVDFGKSSNAPGTQTPSCNYTLSRTFTWTDLPSWITKTPNGSNEANAVLNFAQSTNKDPY